MNVSTLSLGPLGTNCYIVSKNNKALIFDPGGEPTTVKRYLEENNLTPVAILLTHAHFDHIGAVDDLRKYFNIDVYLHENEAEWLENPELNRSLIHFGSMGAMTSQAPDHILKEGKLQLDCFEFDIIHTPGHSPGSVTFIFEKYHFIISGDVLFHHGIGRTDLPEGSITVLAHSITNKLFKLPDDFTVYPGHGIHTTIGVEKKTNPYTLSF